MNYIFLFKILLVLIAPATFMVAFHHIFGGIVKHFWRNSWLHCATEMGWQDDALQSVFYWFFFVIRAFTCLMTVLIFLTVCDSAFDANKFINHYEEKCIYYENKTNPTLEDIVEISKFNKNFTFAKHLAKTEVKEKLRKIDETKVLGRYLENAKNANKD